MLTVTIITYRIRPSTQASRGVQEGSRVYEAYNSKHVLVLTRLSQRLSSLVTTTISYGESQKRNLPSFCPGTSCASLGKAACKYGCQPKETKSKSGANLVPLLKDPGTPVLAVEYSTKQAMGALSTPFDLLGLDAAGEGHTQTARRARPRQGQAGRPGTVLMREHGTR
jgi:hypothetical protein